VSWATPEELRALAADLKVPAPADDDQAQRLLDQAARDLEAYVLGARDLVLDALSDGQRDALSRAACMQALWRSRMDKDDVLGVDDRLASIDGITLAPRPSARYSTAAAAELALHGLVARSGTVMAEPTVAPTLPWWYG
jgi:hypothetical protein